MSPVNPVFIQQLGKICKVDYPIACAAEVYAVRFADVLAVRQHYVPPKTAGTRAPVSGASFLGARAARGKQVRGVNYHLQAVGCHLVHHPARRLGRADNV